MREKEKQQSTPAWKEMLKRHIPILKWLPHYKKEDLIGDMIAGLTVGLTLIPQSVAYAGLAGLSPEYGLYSSFMGGFIYMFFGTVKEVSVGPNSLISLLTLEFTRDFPVEFVFLLSFVCGCIELFLGILQFGFLVNFISVPVTTSFQSATALIIISSQLKDFLGLPKFKSGRFVTNVVTVAGKIQETRMGDLTLSIFCCIFLLSLRKLKDVKISTGKESTRHEKIIKKTLWFISISRNALCVLLSCIACYIFSLHGEFPFKLSGNIPSGIPPFKPPPFYATVGNETLSFTELVLQAGPGVLAIPFIAILANVTIAKAFSTGSPVDATQEMVTLGLCNIGGSFFSSMPTGGAFTRAAVSNSSGVRSPLAGFFTGSLVLMAIKFLTPYFYYIPKATLASVLICAVMFMIDWKTFLLLWKVNKRDFFCSATTFFTCLILGVQVGLMFGVVVNIAQLLYIWARPSISVKVKTFSGENYYVIASDVGLYFPSVDFLRNEITRQCVQSIPVVIDCLHFGGIDYTAAEGIKEIQRCCKAKGQKLLFINMNPKIYRLLKNFNVDINLKQSIDKDEELTDFLFQPEEPHITAILINKEDSDNLKKPITEDSEIGKTLI